MHFPSCSPLSRTRQVTEAGATWVWRRLGRRLNTDVPQSEGSQLPTPGNPDPRENGSKAQTPKCWEFSRERVLGLRCQQFLF